MTSFVNAANASLNGSVLVTTEMVRHTKAQAPTGNGPKMRPTMVVRKMANNRQACFETSAGLGIAKQTMSPMVMEIASGIGFAPGKLGNLMVCRREWVGMVSAGGFDIMTAVPVKYMGRDEEDDGLKVDGGTVVGY
ncbi:hypothetical protein E3N88_20835 [Mikania micrantha]|uniref:Uncharacterized protein n=1 Tax=Mikania micrantha TaxID=192012 RepID=A0A5N6NI79_9ASTR|nr:hypothetical protein E3N88_20835 [Mikania micrantha]